MLSTYEQKMVKYSSSANELSTGSLYFQNPNHEDNDDDFAVASACKKAIGANAVAFVSIGDVGGDDVSEND